MAYTSQSPENSPSVLNEIYNRQVVVSNAFRNLSYELSTTGTLATTSILESPNVVSNKPLDDKFVSRPGASLLRETVAQTPTANSITTPEDIARQEAIQKALIKAEEARVFEGSND